MSKSFVGDIGTKIILDTESDITAQTVLQIKYKKPSGTEDVWSATVENNTEAVYTTQSGDLDEAGTWLFRVYIEMPTWKGHGGVFSKTIYAHEEWE